MVSVLMPVYNCSKTLEKSIKSILTQSYQDFEFIIINDASTDNSVDIIKSFKDDRIKLITNLKNLGCTKSLNIGVNFCTRNFIIRQDGDNISHPKRIECFLSSALNSKAKLITSYYNIANLKKQIELVEDNMVKWMHIFYNHFEHNVMFERNTFLQLKRYNEKYKVSQDYDLWTRYFLQNIPFHIIRTPLYDYFENQNEQKTKAQEINGSKISYNYTSKLLKFKLPKTVFTSMRNKIRNKIALNKQEQILLLSIYDKYKRLYPNDQLTKIIAYVNDHCS